VELVRQRAQRLGDDTPRGDRDRDLAGARAEERPGDLEEVAQVDQVEGVEVVQAVAAEVELDAPGLVTQVQEGGLAHDALRGDAADDRDGDRLVHLTAATNASTACVAVCVRVTRAG
jgi:hypothetical protein